MYLLPESSDNRPIFLQESSDFFVVQAKSALSRHQVDILRKYLISKGIKDLMILTDRSDRTKFRNQVLRLLFEQGLIEMTLPDKPTSSLQQYRTTKLGRTALKQEPTV